MARFRLRYTFWLDMKKPDEESLSDCIEALKAERSFVATVRDGIRLICDLRVGQTDVLFELFPWVRDAMKPIQPAVVDDSLRQQIARLEQLLIAQGNVPIQQVSAEPALRIVPKASTIEVTAGKTTGADVAKNFLNSVAGLTGGWFE